MKIRHMLPADLDFAASLTAAEGWDSETRLEIETLLRYDPHGCFVAEKTNRKIGMCIGTAYQGFGFLGELIVKPEWRQRGLGRELLAHTVRYLQSCGARSVFLDGVPAAVSLYEQAGFVKVCRSWRFSGRVTGQNHPNVRGMKPADLDKVADLDRSAFGANRRFFLQRRLAIYPELCKVLEIDGQISGYIMARHGRSCVSVGPWFIKPGFLHPAAFLESLTLETAGLSLRVGVLDTNIDAQYLLERLGFEKSDQSPWRMGIGEIKIPGKPSRLFAIGSPAKG